MTKTRGVGSRPGVGRPAGISRGLEPLPPLPDRELSYYREGMRWSFSGGKIWLAGHDVNRLISDSESDIPTWLGIGGGLDEYRKKIAAVGRHLDQFARFEAVVEALLGKILGRLKRVYDQKTTGISWVLEGGQLVLNGINVRSFLALYRVRKTDKARRFLKGLKQKLALLLENQRGASDYERIRETVEDLFREIDGELAEPAPPSGRILLPPRSDSP